MARHADKVMGRPVYAQVHHRAAALMLQLIRMPALEYANEPFGAIAAAAHLLASGPMVTVDHKQAVDLAERIARDGFDVPEVADEIKGLDLPSARLRGSPAVLPRLGDGFQSRGKSRPCRLGSPPS
ncbi:fic family toxin-antitoxin system, toxin component [Streptomyces sp. NPDC001675]